MNRKRDLMGCKICMSVRLKLAGKMKMVSVPKQGTQLEVKIPIIKYRRWSLMIKVLFVDDHEMVRIGVAAYLSAQSDIEVIGEAENGSEGCVHGS